MASIIFVSFLLIPLALAANVPDKFGGYRPLYPEAVAEFPCIAPVPKEAFNLDDTWYNTARTWYIPTASQYAFYLYANILLGRPAEVRDELERMCLTSPSDEEVNDVIGFGARITQQIVSGPAGYTQSFVNTTGSAGTLSNALSVENDVVVLTDSATFALVVRCVNALYKDWLVYSITPTLPESTLRTIKAEVVKLGFKKECMIENIHCNHSPHSEFAEQPDSGKME